MSSTFWRTALRAPGEGAQCLFSAGTHTFPEAGDARAIHSPAGLWGGEHTAVLTPHQSPAVTATLCLSFPHCSQGDAVTWQRAGGASASPQHLGNLQKGPGFPTHSCRSVAVSCNDIGSVLKGIYPPHVTLRGQVGSSSEKVLCRCWLGALNQ